MAAKWLIPALTYLCLVRGQSPCTTPDGKSGDCKSIIMCDSLRGMANKPGVTREEIDFLKRSACGFDDAIPKVCCPTTSRFTLENKAGECIDILKCDHIKNQLSSPGVTQEYKIYVNSLRCQGPAAFSVYCGPPPVTSPAPPPNPPPTPAPGNGDECVATAALPDPTTDCCGQDGSSNRITGGNATAIDQYPWLALIEYKKDSKIKLLCGGVLISGRYVLTAGHCVIGSVLNSGDPSNVRLGEYDTANSGPDCVEVEGGEPGTLDCTVDPVIIPIERVIPHPDYNPRNSLKWNDIAMLRLKHIAPYTDFVRPICLPVVDITGNFPETGKLFAAGWGAVNEKISSSNVKLHVDLPYKNMEFCQRAYTVLNRRFQLWERQVCAGGEVGKDSCKGDSGGPLMYSDGNRFEVIGIVSFGPVPCGLENVPGVYTKVFEYITWIRSNIQP
ncbi:phenoloxidase-activating enzyme-like isoform X2 [Choristoneura fumiferana]|uniref:phenoloxidase-activating enzyme-like isoform X2 n=1 Tax=Choristoneura fumiferana TaxID=7141 RepID=UPI003D157A52